MHFGDLQAVLIDLSLSSLRHSAPRAHSASNHRVTSMRFLRLLTGAVAPFLTLSIVSAMEARCFPPDFMFGSATAAYQVEGAVKEGGRTPSIWDDFCRERSGVQCANVADDFYHRYKDDVKLMADTGLESFRFSISWSRVMNWNPKAHRMKPNPEGIAWYHSLVDELLRAHITPVLTIYHWDLPTELQNQLEPKGWLNPDIIGHYLQFAVLLFNEFGRKVNIWTTFNEPLSFVGGGYSLGAQWAADNGMFF